jgi:hypothetical protein
VQLVEHQEVRRRCGRLNLVQHAVQKPIALLLICLFDRLERRQQAKYVHVNVVEEECQHVHGANEIGELAFAFQVETQEHRIVAQTDNEHTAHLFDQIEKNTVARIGKGLFDVSELVGHLVQAEIGQELACFHRVFGLVHHLIANQQELEYLQDVVRVRGVNDRRDETISFGEGIHGHRELDSTSTSKAEERQATTTQPAAQTSQHIRSFRCGRVVGYLFQTARLVRGRIVVVVALSHFELVELTQIVVILIALERVPKVDYGRETKRHVDDYVVLEELVTCCATQVD